MDIMLLSIYEYQRGIDFPLRFDRESFNSEDDYWRIIEYKQNQSLYLLKINIICWTLCWDS